MVLALELFAHDARAPLATTRLILSRMLENEEQLPRSLLQAMVDNLLTIEQLFDDLLAAKRLGEATMAPLSLDELVADCSDTCSEPARVAVTALPTPVRGDATLLTRAVLNLVENALVHADGAVTVHVGSVPDGALVIVDDSGRGIPLELRDLVFQPCIRLEPVTSCGAGLGLPLVRRIAGLHGGSSWAEESPTGGCRFCLLLPRA